VPKKWGDYIKSDINMQADINMHSMSDDELNARIAQALKYLK
jgi:siroheme synthase (precorrin-2 oxidase/ferrochelatase)